MMVRYMSLSLNGLRQTLYEIILTQLEQLECLHFEDIPRPRITHTTDQFLLDPKSKQYEVKVTNAKNLPKFQIF